MVAKWVREGGRGVAVLCCGAGLGVMGWELDGCLMVARYGLMRWGRVLVGGGVLLLEVELEWGGRALDPLPVFCSGRAL